MSSTSLQVTNSPFHQGDDEIITHKFDFSAILPTSVTVASGVLTVLDLSENEAAVTGTVAPGSVTTSSPTCSVSIKLLEAGHEYKAEMLATLSDGQKYRGELIIKCQR